MTCFRINGASVAASAAPDWAATSPEAPCAPAAPWAPPPHSPLPPPPVALHWTARESSCRKSAQHAIALSTGASPPLPGSQTPLSSQQLARTPGSGLSCANVVAAAAALPELPWPCALRCHEAYLKTLASHGVLAAASFDESSPSPNGALLMPAVPAAPAAPTVPPALVAPPPCSARSPLSTASEPAALPPADLPPPPPKVLATFSQRSWALRTAPRVWRVVSRRRIAIVSFPLPDSPPASRSTSDGRSCSGRGLSAEGWIRSSSCNTSRASTRMAREGCAIDAWMWSLRSTACAPSAPVRASGGRVAVKSAIIARRTACSVSVRRGTRAVMSSAACISRRAG